MPIFFQNHRYSSYACIRVYPESTGLYKFNWHAVDMQLGPKSIYLAIYRLSFLNGRYRVEQTFLGIRRPYIYSAEDIVI